MGYPTDSSKSKYIVVGIDGTGSTEWMKPDGSNSHTYRFVHEFRYGTYGVDRMWFHGPSDTMRGKETEPILQDALNFVTRRLYQLFPQIKGNHQAFEMFDVNSCKQAEYYSSQMPSSEYGGSYAHIENLKRPRVVNSMMLRHQPLSTDDVKVVIIGHSRGGLAAAVLARMLSPIVKVYFLGLYDSVDRQPCLDGMVVENVRAVYHARRHPDMNSRWYFSNTSVEYKSDLPAREEFFHTTHGGVGGDFNEDPKQVTFGSDSTCVPYGKERIPTRGGYTEVDRTHPVAKKEGRPINLICEDGKKAADRFIREGAKRHGLPVS
jgi:pimeloyl-ACP methyl ester carboxylesterase